MAITQLQIINLALIEMGHSPVQSLESGDALVQSAVAIWDIKLPAVLASGNWRFAIQAAQLSKLTEEAPYPWNSVYSLPAGWLKTIRINPGVYDWDIYNNEKIYTYQDGPLYMDYCYMVPVSHFPAHFTDYFVLEIAAPLSLSNAQKVDYYATLEAKRINMQGMAMALDAQNRPNFSQRNFPALSARNIGGVLGGGISNG